MSAPHGLPTGTTIGNRDATAVFASQMDGIGLLSVPLPRSPRVSQLFAPMKAGDYDGFHGGHQSIAHEVRYVSREAAVRGKTRQLVSANLAMAHPMVPGVAPLPKGVAMRGGGWRLLKNPQSTCPRRYPCL